MDIPDRPIPSAAMASGLLPTIDLDPILFASYADWLRAWGDLT